jgi:hypothetical protein
MYQIERPITQEKASEIDLLINQLHSRGAIVELERVARELGSITNDIYELVPIDYAEAQRSNGLSARALEFRDSLRR